MEQRASGFIPARPMSKSAACRNSTGRWCLSGYFPSTSPGRSIAAQLYRVLRGPCCSGAGIGSSRAVEFSGLPWAAAHNVHGPSSPRWRVL